jgi:predicted nucleic acid-binding protein
MAKPAFLPDSNIFISHLNGDLDINAFFAAQPDCDKYVNRIVEIEVLAKPGLTVAEEAEAKALLAQFKRVDMTDAMRDESARIRRTKSLLLPDAIIAATAICLNATVLSNDPHLRDYRHPGYIAQPVL